MHKIFTMGLLFSMFAALVLTACPDTGGIANIAPEIAPKEFQAFAGNQSVGLRWRNPEAVTEDNVLWYTIIRNRTDNPDLDKALIIIYGFASQYDDNGYTVGTTSVGVKNDTEYEYSIYVTLTDNSNSPLVGPVAVMPKGNKPGAIYDFTASSGDGKVDFTWKAPTSGQTPTGYNVYRDGQKIATLPGTATSYSDSGLSNGNTHEYFITAVNGNGEGIPSETKKVTVGAGDGNNPGTLTPGKPGNFTVIPRGGSVDLAWNTPTSGAQPTEYEIYRHDGNSTTKIATTTNRVYRDTPPNDGTYTYWIKAKNNAIEGPDSERVNVTVDSNSSITEYPTAPGNFKVTTSSGKVELEWDAAMNSPTGYYVYRAPGTGTDRALRIATIQSGTTTTYTDTGLTDGSVFTYWVSAFNSTSKQGPFSDTKTVTVGYDDGSHDHDIVTTEPNNFRISTPIGISGNKNDGYFATGYQVTLRWDPPSNTGGRTILGYVVYRGATRLQSGAETSGQNASAYDIPGSSSGERMTTITTDGPNMTLYIDANGVSDGSSSSGFFPVSGIDTHPDYYVQAVYSNDTRSAVAYFDIQPDKIKERIQVVIDSANNGQ